MFRFHISGLKNFSAEYENSYDFFLERCVTLDALGDNALIFVKKKAAPTLLEQLNARKHCLIILLPDKDPHAYDHMKLDNMVIETTNPRLVFARIFGFILDNAEKIPGKRIEPGKGFRQGTNVSIGLDTIIGENVTIENNVVIGDNVRLGDRCHIMSGVVIKDNVEIGARTIVRENVVIGGWGFGFERDEDGIPIRLPHVGGVRIGHDVEIAELVTIDCGTFKPTIVGDYTKIDSHVHVAHNCKVGEACMLVAFAGIAGSVTIGDRCWIGLHSSIIQGTTIGNDCFIGMGAVVKRNVPDGVTVSGDPAQPLEELALRRRIYQRLKRDFVG